MRREIQQKYSELEKLLSIDRIQVYLNLSNNNKIVAYRLYKLNSELSTVLYEILGHLEVLLRNAIVREWNEYLKYSIPEHIPSWPVECTSIDIQARRFLINLTYHNRDIVTAREKFQRYIVKKGTPLRVITNGDLISNLNFGFWYNCLRDPFSTINQTKIYRIFPNAPVNPNLKKGIAQIRIKVDQSYQLRNRIAHHEPIINSNTLLLDFHASMELIKFLEKDYRDCFLEGRAEKFIKLYRKISITTSKFYP